MEKLTGESFLSLINWPAPYNATDLQGRMIADEAAAMLNRVNEEVYEVTVKAPQFNTGDYVFHTKVVPSHGQCILYHGSEKLIYKVLWIAEQNKVVLLVS